MTFRKTNGATIKALRVALGMTGNDLAIAVLISPAYLYNIEANRRQPGPALTLALANRLGVPLDAITYPVANPEKVAV